MNITLIVSISTNLSIMPIMHMGRFVRLEINTLI